MANGKPIGTALMTMCQKGIDYNVRQLALIHHLAGDLTPEQRLFKSVVKVLKVNKPSVTRAADRLQEDGLLSRKVVPEDRRMITLALTPKGKTFATAYGLTPLVA